MLVSYLGKEGIWQVRILSVMMLWTIKFPTEVWKCESKVCIESRHQAHKPVLSKKSTVLQLSTVAGKETGRKGRQSAA